MPPPPSPPPTAVAATLTTAAVTAAATRAAATILPAAIAASAATTPTALPSAALTAALSTATHASTSSPPDPPPSPPFPPPSPPTLLVALQVSSLEAAHTVNECRQQFSYHLNARNEELPALLLLAAVLIGILVVLVIRCIQSPATKDIVDMLLRTFWQTPRADRGERKQMVEEGAQSPSTALPALPQVDSEAVAPLSGLYATQRAHVLPR